MLSGSSRHSIQFFVTIDQDLSEKNRSVRSGGPVRSTSTGRAYYARIGVGLHLTLDFLFCPTSFSSTLSPVICYV
jgi:hypothetical protein